jgi:hypothetical protein
MRVCRLPVADRELRCEVKGDNLMPGIIDATYLPFSEDDLKSHFLRGADEQLRHFVESADRYHKFRLENKNNLRVRQDQARVPCQIEKDERFWTAAALMKVIGAPDPVHVLTALLSRAFGPGRPWSPLTTGKAASRVICDWCWRRASRHLLPTAVG